MAVTAFWYAKGFVSAFNKEIDANEATKIKVMLCEYTYTPNQDTHDYISDADGDEVSGTNYTAGGKEVTTLSFDNTNNVIKFDGDDVTWASSTITAQFAVVYYDSGTNTTSPVICWVDFGTNESSSDGDFTIQWHTDGIANITPTDATGFP